MAKLTAMEVRRYFKRDAESELGSGTVWIEFSGEQPVRQVEVYGDRWFDSRTAYHTEIGPGLSDQPLSQTDLRPEHEISAAEFERVWLRATEGGG